MSVVTQRVTAMCSASLVSKLAETKDDKRRKKDMIKLTYTRHTTDAGTLKTPQSLVFQLAAELYGKPEIVIQRQRKAAAVDESINEYDYDNKNDRENFCAQEDSVSGYGDASTPGYDVTDIFSETVADSQTTSCGDKTSNFLGNLVAAPDKVEKINIGYARTAKKVDMKKLKTALWDILSDPSPEKENNKQLENKAEHSKRKKMDSSSDIDFSHLYKALPQRISSSMSGNISVPLVFIGLLHLANEHSLKLSDPGNLVDFTIMQG
ncbi:Condensin complex subunit 2 [Chionoecetes opilio]|uniref:Condensin complex subunit 2 n=1 Tax=Chionoecetes opilio TaxID=41210 RepID=A0A8J5CT45_CHIOP|nr:Condensin complex subunit 2 [Chionoecetes opilio]